MALLKFLKGNYSSLNSKAIAEGQILICGDTGEMFVDVAADKRVKIGDFIVIDTLANLEALDASAVPTSRLYYVEDGNILARSNGTSWVQINKQPTADQIKTMIGLSDYETKSDASGKLTEAKEYADGKFEAVQKEVDDLEKLVGAIPESAEATDIVGYIQEKTAGIATDAALEELTGRVKTAEDDIDAIEASIGTVEEGKTVVGLIATAQSAAEAAQATADKKATMAEVEAKNYATKEEAQGYANAKDEAIAAAKKSGDDAQDAVDALAGKVGTVGEGETVVGMIEALEEEAGKKVASVTAADASVTVGGTSTAPTVAAKLSADADNALTLAEDGLKVVIPAAAEYSIVKAADSGDYAAVYNLTKDGAIVGASINIPKDLVVKSGKVENGNIVLVLNDETNTEITIPAASLIEYVTSGSATGDMVVINIDDEHKVTASITDGSITLAKLHTDIQTAIGKAHVHENADVLAGINADMVAAWNAAEQNAKDHADDLDEAMNVRVEALEAIDHSHANAEVLNGISAEKVSAWDAAEQNAKDYVDEQFDKAKTVFVFVTEDNGDATGTASMTSTEIAAAVQNGNDVGFIFGDYGLRLTRIVSNIAYFGANVNFTFATNDFLAGEFIYIEVAVDADGKYECGMVSIATSKDVNEKIGEVSEGKTVVEMISDAQDAVQGDLDAYQVSNDAAVALKANAADVYAKTETYTQEEVDAAIEDALVAAMSWGEF